MKHKLNRDRMNNIDARPVANAAMQVLDALQVRHLPEAQIMGLAAAFVLLAAHLRTPPQDVFTAVNNLMVASEEDRTEFKAITAYLEGELS